MLDQRRQSSSTQYCKDVLECKKRINTEETCPKLRRGRMRVGPSRKAELRESAADEQKGLATPAEPEFESNRLAIYCGVKFW